MARWLRAMATWFGKTAQCSKDPETDEEQTPIKSLYFESGVFEDKVLRSRMAKEYTMLRPSEFFSAQLCEQDPYSWRIVIIGPPGSVYEGGRFIMRYVFPEGWPWKGPELDFETEIYHPNVGRDGRVAMAAIGDSWTPRLTVADVMELLRALG